tara:strand:- start:156 stop:284 length:129 start_codon:yes stop_codon:yes gene_type:complete
MEIASSQSGTEMVAVAICNLRLFPRLAVAIPEAIDPTYRVND